MKKLIIVILITFWQIATAFSQSNADDIIGYYLATDPKTKETTQMEVYKTTDGKYEVRVVWVENKKNSNNVGTIPIRNLTFDSKSKEWKQGKVMYEGKEYSLNASFSGPDKLKIRGFLGISLFGKTEYWIKEKELRK